MRASIIFSILSIAVVSASAEFEHHVHENMTEVERAFIRHDMKDRLLLLPRNKLILHFESDKKVNLGNEFTPKDTTNQPNVIYEPEAESFYTLIAFDIDSPRRNATFFGEVIVWLVVNIPGSKVHKGDTLVEYSPVWPFKNTGSHRVIFLLFKQKEKQIFEEEYVQRSFLSFRHRIGFSTTKFSLKYNLGSPIAGNFFETQFDESFMNDAFAEHGLGSTLAFFPKQRLIVYYEHDKYVDLGSELKPMDILNTPNVAYDADPDEYYTLIAIDPDSPKRNAPTFGELLLWQVVNIPGSKVKSGETATEYTATWPSSGSGIHRLVFLLFKQQEKHVFTEEYIPSMPMPIHHRIGFSTIRFSMKYGLGDPIAGNFFEIQYDNSFMNEVHRYD
ncbi:hypothetical protein WA026_010593 [Henosepilachna vigintioctopunctata]|uniref:Uncharacterized protein n=1 Tax=Henosepilachna vigintioctopunctata TaxID=420089 RepID=A0AAW1V4B5_9CUCU